MQTPYHGPDSVTASPLGPDLSADSSLRWRQHLLAGSALVAIALVLWFGPLGVRWLHGPDEGRYAEIAREMLLSRDWLTPRLNDILYFEKPPLVYWMTALAFDQFGLSAFSARLWPAISALLPMPILWWVTRRSFDARIATTSVAILASSLWWIGNGHFLNLDMSLSAFMAIGTLMIWAANLPETTDRQATRRMRAAWVALALAILSKGIVAVVVLGSGTGLYLLMTRDWRMLRRLSLFEGGLILITLCAPWFMLMETRNPGFLNFFFVHEHFQRFTSTVHRRTGPWYYFVPILAIGAFPWTSHLIEALKGGLKRRGEAFQVERFLIIQAAAIFVFFSVSGSKLPSYILPMFVPLSVLLAVGLASRSAMQIGRHLMRSATMLAALGVTALIVVTRSSSPDAAGGVMPFAASILASLMLMTAVGFWLVRRGQHLSSTRATLLVAITALVSLQIALCSYQFVEVERASTRWLAKAAPYIGPDTPIYSVGTYDQTLPFYLQRPITLVDYVDEFETGIKREPHRQIPTIDAFIANWGAQQTGIAYLPREVFDQLRRSSLPMNVIAEDERRVLVRRP